MPDHYASFFKNYFLTYCFYYNFSLTVNECLGSHPWFFPRVGVQPRWPLPPEVVYDQLDQMDAEKRFPNEPQNNVDLWWGDGAGGFPPSKV